MAIQDMYDEKLIEFALTTANFALIWDLRPANLGWVDKIGWVQFDWDFMHVLANSDSKKTAFDHWSEFLEDSLVKRIQSAINKKRRGCEPLFSGKAL